jgi:hypothetical protein
LRDPGAEGEQRRHRRHAPRIEELLRIRASSRLFALGSAAAVQQRLSFANTGPAQLPGVIAMRLSDEAGTDVDPAYESIVVVFNGTDEPQQARTVAVFVEAG